MLRLGRRLLLAAICLFTAPWAAASEPPLVLVASERSGAYGEAIEALLGELERSGLSRAEVVIITTKELATLATRAPRLVIAIGSAAAQALADGDSRLQHLYTLLPKSAADPLLARRRQGKPASAIYLDQTYSRQLDLLRLALPEARQLAVLLGPAAPTLPPALSSAAAERGLHLNSGLVEANSSLYPVLQQLLGRSDVLLALADPAIFNSNSIQNILLASFRARVPLLAFSPAYVKAGALLAIYATPAQIGTQTGVLARAVLLGKALPAPQYPTQFTLQINQHVAHSLGLSLDESELSQKLKEMERTQ